MGSCSSVPREPETAVGYRLCLVSKAKKFFASSSPAKEKPLNVENKSVAGFGFQSPDFGSKEDIFFESQAWLDSDCEDDFFSVNGEFTPSRGSTPNRQSNAALTPQLNKTFPLEKFSDSKSEPSPTGRKKLLELFSESLENGGDGVTSNAAEESIEINTKPDIYKMNSDQPSKSSNGTPNISGVSSTRSNIVTPSRDPRIRKEKAWKSAHCCLPGLQTLGFDERRQKMSPGPCAFA